MLFFLYLLWSPIQGGAVIPVVASCQVKQDQLWLDGSLGSSINFTCLYSQQNISDNSNSILNICFWKWFPNFCGNFCWSHFISHFLQNYIFYKRCLSSSCIVGSEAITAEKTLKKMPWVLALSCFNSYKGINCILAV